MHYPLPNTSHVSPSECLCKFIVRWSALWSITAKPSSGSLLSGARVSHRCVGTIIFPAEGNWILSTGVFSRSTMVPWDNKVYIGFKKPYMKSGFASTPWHFATCICPTVFTSILWIRASESMEANKLDIMWIILEIIICYRGRGVRGCLHIFPVVPAAL